MAIKPVTVTQLNEYIRSVLQNDPIMRFVRVTGDITSIKFHSNGSVYLTISDMTSKIECVVFPDKIDETVKNLSDGDKIIIEGSIGVSTKLGKYSIWVKTVEIEGESDLAKNFQILKEKLNKEGLFDKKYKKPIPKFPKVVGIVTSDTGAAVQDIKKIITSRTNLVDLIIFPVLVQGIHAPADIIRTLNIINSEYIKKIDLIILGRGGGSPEDLAVFNDEGIARAIFESKIPIISAVGHEIDTTISDLVADIRAETPTAAAQMAVPNNKDLISETGAALRNLNTYLSNRLILAEMNINDAKNQMNIFMREKLRRETEEVNKSILILKENDPRNVLAKGFAVISGDNGHPITSVENLLKGEKYKITLTDGNRDCRIE